MPIISYFFCLCNTLCPFFIVWEMVSFQSRRLDFIGSENVTIGENMEADTTRFFYQSVVLLHLYSLGDMPVIFLNCLLK